MLSEGKDNGRSTATSESTEATEEAEEAEEGEEQEVRFGQRLTSFQSLVFVKAFKEEKVMCLDGTHKIFRHSGKDE